MAKVIGVLNVKVVVAIFNQEKALVGALSVITNLRMQLFEALLSSEPRWAVRRHSRVQQATRHGQLCSSQI